MSILSPSVDGGGSDSDLSGRYSANGPPIETRWGIVLHLFTTHPSSSESFSANGLLSPTVSLIKLLHATGRCSSQGEEPKISYQDKTEVWGTLR